MKSMSGMRDHWRQLCSRLAKAVKARRNDIRMGLVLLGLIIFPSGLLGYFSWRAMESEKLFSRERLQESYHQFARLAAREIDNEIKEVEQRWVTAANEVFGEYDRMPTAEQLERLEDSETLIARCFFFASPGKVFYPPGGALWEGRASHAAWEKEPFVREHEVFNTMAARGEELEYRAFDLDGALVAYRDISSRVSNPRLRGMAESYVGRALMKKGEWNEALKVFQKLLANYPEVRDLNDMHLRFLAQYQMAGALENLDRDHEAIETLFALNRDLQERSDAVNPVQYDYFLDQIRDLMPRLLASPKLSDRARYQAQFQTLGEQSKKRISQRYFLQLLERKLNSAVVERKHYKARFRYLSDEAADEPYLLAYRFLPDVSGSFVSGLIGLQIDLAQLHHQLFPAILHNLKFSDRVTLAILNGKGDYVIGTAKPAAQPIAIQTLAAPFDLWQVAVYLNDASLLARRWSFRATLGLWLISLLLLSILSGAYIFIRRAQQEARLSRMKSTFVSNVSHELRTPLASIKMLAELMEMQLSGRNAVAAENYKARVEQYLSVIRRESDRLSRLIESLLNFSKIERGMKQYDFEYEDPAAVVHLAVESFRLHAEAQGFKLDVEITEPLGEVRMDADAITQVMLNLLSNAVKYSDQIKEICVRADRDDQHVKVEVSDRGIGIEAAEIPKIFDDFYRVDQRLSSQQQGGVGLGLTLVRHIVSAHGGAVTVQSEVGKGSTFRFTLPVADEHAQLVNVAIPMNVERKSAARIDQHIETAS